MCAANELPAAGGGQSVVRGEEDVAVVVRARAGPGTTQWRIDRT